LQHETSGKPLKILKRFEILSSKTPSHFINPEIETFTFHQLLHRKRCLLNETELAKSAKGIVVNFMMLLKEQGFTFSSETEKEFEVSCRLLQFKFNRNRQV
jgi:hypothetical protein